MLTSLTTVTLALAACGTNATGQFHPAGSAPAAPTGSPAPTLASFPLPSSVHINFDTPLPLDPVQAKAVVTDEDFQLAYYYSLYSQGKDQRFAPYIASRTVLFSVQADVAQSAAKQESITGTVRFFNTTVQPTLGARGDLTVSSCGDDTQLLNTSGSTGQVVPDHTTPPDHHYFLQSDTYFPRNGGNWGLVAIALTYYPQGSAKECKP
jgi:hypothetical protein